jgi:hypothetical protein
MSLVICSNSFKDDTISRQNNSVDNPFSFRNALSSTYTIPANSQVALQSAKLNIDGKVVYSRNAHKFYQYFGKKLDLDGETEPQIEDTTSHPILVQLAETEAVQEKAPTDFAVEVERSLNERIFHPNMKDKVSVSVLNNASDFDFKGYKIVYDQVNTNTENKPTQGFKQWYRKDGIYAGATSNFFSYTGDVFQRNASLNQYDVCAGINTQFPLNLGSGVFEVNISHGNGNVNASGTEVEFMVGLSRFVNNENTDGYINPSYYDPFAREELGYIMDITFMDFGVGINANQEIVCFQTAWIDRGDGEGALRLEEVKYWENASSDYSGNGGRKDSTEGQYTKIKMEAEGERMKAEIYNASTSAWEIITKYLAGAGKDNMFTPINQAQWCLHPVFQIGSNDNNASGKIEFHTYQGIDITGYDPTTKYKGGWYETMELIGKDDLCENVESRLFNQTDDVTAYVQENTNASGGVSGTHVLILQESDIYEPSYRANAKDLLGFNRDVVDTSIVVQSQSTFESVKVPTLINNMSLFVRLNNLGQNVMNAFTGNKSKIIAHLTKLETETGIVSYEPNNYVWLDLDNPSDINLTDFDISINYINEQYARTLVGDSIVCLYFREKPKM